MNAKTAVIGASAAALVLAACTLSPSYTRPKSPVPAAWPKSTVQTQDVPQAAAAIPWMQFFGGDGLRAVIALALENNRDLRIAALNIERFRAQFQIRRADLFPKVDAAVSGSVQRVPETLSPTGSATTAEQYGATVGISAYELDMFGRVRSLRDQALQQYLASEHAGRSVRISLVSQVAVGWLMLAADRERLELAKETLANQLASYNLVKSRFDAGVATALDLNQARTGVEAARVDIARYTALAAQDENALNLIVGSPVPEDRLPRNLTATVTTFADLAPGLVSDALLDRPDIQQAEGELKGANANIGAARAAFFPRITLTTSAGFGSDELSGLFRGNASAWSFIPRIVLPIFDGGANRANLKMAETDRDIAVARYEKAIQTAFREVADALAQRATIDEQLVAQQSFADSTTESHRLSQARYEKGVDSYLQVLDAQRAFYGAQQALIGARLLRLTNLVTLYKALGGGVK